MSRFDLVIIGAGPAGLMAAIAAHPLRILLVEGKSKPGRKLLVTGAEKCNITRSGSLDDFLSGYGANGHFLRFALQHFSNHDLVHFFTSRGCPLITRADGKIFPKSEKASDVLHALLEENRRLGTHFLFSESVHRIHRQSDGFVCHTKGSQLSAASVLIATGGKSYPATGSQGQGYSLATSLGHSVIAPKPALTPIYMQNFPLRNLSGLTFTPAEISLIRNGKKIHTRKEPLLITHQGFSGPAVLHLSRFIEPSDHICINFMPEMNHEKLEAALLAAPPGRTLNSFFAEFLPKKFISEMIHLAEIPEGQRLSSLSRENRKKIIHKMLSFPIREFQTGSFLEAMATAGGIPLEEIQPRTMESRICPGLFFAGEVLNIDGDTGGYNLQAAFSTGFLAGNSARLNLQGRQI